MIAVLPAAGEGVRLRPITNDLPKVMVKIAGKPLLEYHIENLKKVGVSTFCINLHYFSKVITDYFGDGEKFGVKIHYFFEEKLLGTAGLLNDFRKDLKERFFLVAGDAFLPDFNFLKMLKFHQSKKALLTIVLKERTDRSDTDYAMIDQSGKVIKLFPRPHKIKPPTNLDTCMVYIVEPKILQFLPKRGVYDFIADFLPQLVEKKLPVYGYKTQEYVQDIGTIKRYKEAQALYSQ